MKVDFLTTPPEARPIPLALELAGRVADEQARRRLFADHQDRRSEETNRQQRITLATFRAWLANTAADPGDLAINPDAWQAITWGLVAGFIRAQLAQGYAVTTVNSRLATIKRYAGLALQAGSMPADQYSMIRIISGYSRREARNLNQQREQAGIATRTGTKAAAPIVLDPDQVEALKTQPETPQGLRDAFLMCLLLDHGLRCSEVAGLIQRDFRPGSGELYVYRPKVDNASTHKLSADTRRAARLYLAALDQPDPAGPLLLTTHKSGQLTGFGMGTRGINKRVGVLGLQIGIEGLSPHDCRHTAATYLARKKDVKELMEIFGWASPAMAVRYIQASALVEVD